MIDYNQYTTEDPFMSISIDSLLESKGIPNILKEIGKSINNDISGNENNFSRLYNFDYENLNTTILVKVINSVRNDIYSKSTFGYYFEKKLAGCEIIINFNINKYNNLELERVITHELLHIYEIFNRVKNNSKKDLQWFANKILYDIESKYKSKFIQDISYLMYLSFDQEINARVSETYIILMDSKITDNKILLNQLKTLNLWKYSNDLINFDYKTYNIDYSELFNFLVEFNTSISNKYNKLNYNLYKIPNSKKDCIDIVKKWIQLFKKKGKYLQRKLIKIIDEVINDVNMTESAYIQFDDTKNLSNKYVLKYDIFLERESKLNKLLR